MNHNFKDRTGLVRAIGYEHRIVITRTRDARTFVRCLDETLVRWGDPASIWPLLPADNARRHVDLIGADRILDQGRKAIEAADYRWAVQVLHHVVFADPDNTDPITTEAKNLQADAYEQLGYQQEIPQWRGSFLTAAMEPRQGVNVEGAFSSASPDTILNMPTDQLFDFAAIHVIGDTAADIDIRINVTITDRNEEWAIWVANGVLNARPAHSDDAQLSISGPKAAIVGFLVQPEKAAALVASGKLDTFASVM